MATAMWMLKGKLGEKVTTFSGHFGVFLGWGWGPRPGSQGFHMNCSCKPLPDAEVLRQTCFGSKVISFAAVVFPSNAWDTGCSNGPPEGNGGW